MPPVTSTNPISAASDSGSPRIGTASNATVPGTTAVIIAVRVAPNVMSTRV